MFLLFDENKFKQKLKNKLTQNGIIDTKLFEIILYAFLFCVQSLDALDILKRNKTEKKLLFASLLEKNCINNLKDCYIPGNDLPDEMHISSLESIEEHLNSYDNNFGCYVCSCGYYYSIEPCGFPEEGATSICPICKLEIGHGPKIKNVGFHSLIIREGHMRIFKNQKQKDECMEEFLDSDENVPNMLLEEYKKKVIEPILNKFKNGLNVVEKEYFLKRNKKVRKLNELGYRILNFILYSHLFFANCLKYISDEDFEKCLVKGMSCIEIIKQDWNFIQDILKQKGIQSIQIFMNLIFKRISNLIKNCEYFTDSNSRNEFEKIFGFHPVVYKIETADGACLVRD